ncbi:hypothetical protein [Georgenia sp. SUBG003]|uniref:hypothetical protein n=1 Tax=Georgenia sp. SUBG003 TaxID=1497974 RepID=UPI003AB27E29
MRDSGTPRRPGWSSQLSPARKGWMLMGGGLLVTALLASAGINSSLLAALLAVMMGIGLVLGLAPIFSAGTPSPATGSLPPARFVPAPGPRPRVDAGGCSGVRPSSAVVGVLRDVRPLSGRHCTGGAERAALHRRR